MKQDDLLKDAERRLRQAEAAYLVSLVLLIAAIYILSEALR